MTVLEDQDIKTTPHRTLPVAGYATPAGALLIAAAVLFLRCADRAVAVGASG